MDPPPIIGNADCLIAAKREVEQLANNAASVCLSGATGCGKEVFARHVHSVSGRKGEFVPLNCGGWDENLVRSELFGHEAGAFTGAMRQRKGVFERANGGTVFLDEIGDLPLGVQVQLLRVLDDKKVERLGAEKLVKCDFRLVCATNQDLVHAVEDGTFREDLYYRVATNPVRIPSLRDRREDIPALIEHFCKNVNHKGTDPAVWSPAQDYDWPGNVRELERFVERVVAIYGPDGVSREDVEIEIARQSSRTPRPKTKLRHKDEARVPADLEKWQPYMTKLGFARDPSNDAAASLATYVSKLDVEQRQSFLLAGCRIPQDSLLLTVVADAVALVCVEQADRRRMKATTIAAEDFGLHRMSKKSVSDLAAVERAVRDRLTRQV